MAVCPPGQTVPPRPGRTQEIKQCNGGEKPLQQTEQTDKLFHNVHKKSNNVASTVCTQTTFIRRLVDLSFSEGTYDNIIAVF